jgi:hypothetical protein
MHKDCAAEALEIEGWCPNEGYARGGAKRAHTGAPYAELRAYLGVQDFCNLGTILGRKNSRPWRPHENHGTPTCTLGPVL